MGSAKRTIAETSIEDEQTEEIVIIFENSPKSFLGDDDDVSKYHIVNNSKVDNENLFHNEGKIGDQTDSNITNSECARKKCNSSQEDSNNTSIEEKSYSDDFNKLPANQLSLKLLFESLEVLLSSFPGVVKLETRKALSDIVKKIEIQIQKKNMNESEINWDMDLKDIPTKEFFQKLLGIVSSFPLTMLVEAKLSICALVFQMELLAQRERERNKYSATFSHLVKS